MLNLETEFLLVIFILLVTTWAMRFLSQISVILAPIATGFVLQIFQAKHWADFQFLHTIENISVLLIVFMIGLELNAETIKKMGVTTLLAGLSTGILTWALSNMFLQWIFPLWGPLKCGFVAAIFANPSTLSVFKYLEHKKLMQTHLARSLISLLILEDITILLILQYLTKPTTVIWFQKNPNLYLPWLLGLCLMFIGVWWLVGSIVFPKLIGYLEQILYSDVVLVFIIGSILGLSQIFEYFDFSPTLGAVLIGILVAELKTRHVYEKKLEPVVALCQILFFIGFGFSVPLAQVQWGICVWYCVGGIGLIAIARGIVTVFMQKITGKPFEFSVLVLALTAQSGEMGFIILNQSQDFSVFNPSTYGNLSMAVLVSMLTMYAYYPVALKLVFWLKKKQYIGMSYTNFLAFDTKFFYMIRHIKQYLMHTKIAIWLSKILNNTSLFVQFFYTKSTAQNYYPTLRRLAPWEDFILPFTIPVQSIYIGKTLLELQIDKQGCLIVAIERHSIYIVTPMSSEILMPEDTIYLYGSEEHMQCVCAKLSVTVPNTDNVIDLAHCSNQLFILDANHPFVGHSIWELQLKQKQCLVLGVLRQDTKIRNPKHDFIFQEMDWVYCFGEEKFLAQLV
jgi:Kef-type K+ transport system membrane component KefB/Trk K+ transport system NAD-binding subunit